MRRLLRRALKGGLVALAGVAALLAASAAPIAWVETRCLQTPAASAPPPALIAEGRWRRPLVQSFLSYPEWYIVHAYEDFAAVLARADEPAFDYVGSIRGFWSSLCDLSALSTRQAPMPGDMKSMLYVIGVSFTAEMAVKGAYEETVGRLTAWWRGGRKTPEDAFAAGLASDYAAFLQQTPWYQYPFSRELRRLWDEVPLGQVSLARSLERRAALSAEYGVKAGYAVLIGAAAGLAPADLRIRSVVAGLPASALAADPRITVVEEIEGAVLIESDRYRAFTRLLADLTARGATVREIAGNRVALVTALMPEAAPSPGGQPVFSLAVQARPGFRRVGLAVDVETLGPVMRAVAEAGGTFEHLYDY